VAKAAQSKKLKGAAAPRPKKPPKPSGIASVDALADAPTVALQDYINAVSEYVRVSHTLKAGPKKAAQIRLSNGLARALLDELTGRLPYLKGFAGERTVSGALRTVNADVSESHELDGLRLAVELKPVNLAVGRAIWNRFGDIRTFAVNLHLRFPFAVVGGVLVIPTYELKATAASKKELADAEQEEDIELALEEAEASGELAAPGLGARKDTRGLISKAVSRLVRAGGRQRDSDAPHLLEAIAVVVYDPDTGTLDPDLPPPNSGLRWEEFVDTLVYAYEVRFE
jgi:hypothetical protein